MAAVTGTAPRRRVAVLIACHNRRELTLRALRSLAAQKAVFDLTVVLFDDGSSDGTAQAVRAEFPETIVLAGDGSAFWNRGMYAAWTRACELAPDGYLWLNDDVALDPDALARLGAAWDRADGPGVWVGATRDARGALTYGAMRRAGPRAALRFERLPESADIQRAETMNGNVVLVDAATVARIGLNDPAYFHMYGDIDYGLRASAAGIPVWQLPGTLGVCEGNPAFDLAALSWSERWRHLLRSPRGVRPASWWRFARRHAGVLAPLAFAAPYRRLFYPRAWLK